VLGGLVRGREGKGWGELCVDGRLCWGDWLEGWKGRDWGRDIR